MATIAKKNGKHQVQIRKVGQPYHCKSFTYLADARQWALKIESKFERGEQPYTLSANVKFDNLADRYAETIIPQFKSAKREVSRLRLMQARMGNISIASMTNTFFAEYRDNRLKKVSPQTVKHEINIVRRVIKHATQEWGLVLPLGIPSVRLPKLPRGRSRRISDDELQRIKHRLSPVVSDLVDLALETAMRRSELLAICSAHIDWDCRHLNIHETKNGISRTVPLTLKASSTLAKYSNADHCFRIAPDSVSQAFRRAVKAEAILGLTFHDLRHEAITRLFEKGLSIPQVAGISGHNDYRMLARYTHLHPVKLE